MCKILKQVGSDSASINNTIQFTGFQLFSKLPLNIAQNNDGFGLAMPKKHFILYVIQIPRSISEIYNKMYENDSTNFL